MTAGALADVQVMLQGALGLVFVAAAVAKLATGDSIESFLRALDVPSAIARWAARGVPYLELGVGALLLVGGTGVAPAYCAFAMALGFAGVQAEARRRRIKEDCRCFGLFDARLPAAFPLPRAVLLVIASLTLVVLATMRPGLHAFASEHAFSLAALAGVAIGAAYVLSFALLASALEFERKRPRPDQWDLERTIRRTTT